MARIGRPKQSHTRRKAVLAGFRSGFEQRMAELRPDLFYEKKPYSYVVQEERKYTPDFVNEDESIWYETKGRLTAADRKKMLQVKKHYPDQRIVFVFQAPNNKLTKAPNSQTYEQWALKNGFEVMSVKEMIDAKD